MHVFTYRRYLVTVLLLTEVLDWTQLFPWAEECNFPRYTFGYADRNGPHMWKLLYPDSNGGNQSPINVTTQLAVVVQPSEPLRWSGYDKGPLSMTITNNENNGAIFHHRFNKQNYLFRSAPTNYSIAARNIFLYVFFFFFFISLYIRNSVVLLFGRFITHRYVSISSGIEHDVEQHDSTVHPGWMFDQRLRPLLHGLSLGPLERGR